VNGICSPSGCVPSTNVEFYIYDNLYSSYSTQSFTSFAKTEISTYDSNKDIIDAGSIDSNGF